MLWSFVSRIVPHIQYPLLVGGDFNVVLSCEDRMQGNPMTLADVEDFQQSLQVTELQEVRAVGA